MEHEKIETRKEMLTRLQKAAQSMTQEQVDACAWQMGTFACGWTPATLAAEYQSFIDHCGIELTRAM